jgi:hypothetical protein
MVLPIGALASMLMQCGVDPFVAGGGGGGGGDGGDPGGEGGTTFTVSCAETADAGTVGEPICNCAVAVASASPVFSGSSCGQNRPVKDAFTCCASAGYPKTEGSSCECLAGPGEFTCVAGELNHTSCFCEYWTGMQVYGGLEVVQSCEPSQIVYLDGTTASYASWSVPVDNGCCVSGNTCSCNARCTGATLSECTRDPAQAGLHAPVVSCPAGFTETAGCSPG